MSNINSDQLPRSPDYVMDPSRPTHHCLVADMSEAMTISVRAHVALTSRPDSLAGQAGAAWLHEGKLVQEAAPFWAIWNQSPFLFQKNIIRIFAYLFIHFFAAASPPHKPYHSATSPWLLSFASPHSSSPQHPLPHARSPLRHEGTTMR